MDSAFYGQALTINNIMPYLRECGMDGQVETKYKTIPALSYLQKNFGAVNDGDCSLTSIMTILKYNFPHLSPLDIYDVVHKYAKKCLFTPSIGLIPLFNKTVISNAAKELGTPIPFTSKYLKIGATKELIKQIIDNERLAMLSINNDGRGYYSAHSVTITGYAEFMSPNMKKFMLMVYDNWSGGYRFLDYDKMNSFISLVY